MHPSKIAQENFLRGSASLFILSGFYDSRSRTLTSQMVSFDSRCIIYQFVQCARVSAARIGGNPRTAAL